MDSTGANKTLFLFQSLGPLKQIGLVTLIWTENMRGNILAPNQMRRRIKWRENGERTQRNLKSKWFNCMRMDKQEWRSFVNMS
jgi:hypothetical protein